MFLACCAEQGALASGKKATKVNLFPISIDPPLQPHLPSTPQSLLANYEAVIGIETHLQLSTATKAFCGCALTRGGAPPNTAVCPVCLGHPGTLPVVNRQVLVKAVVAGMALGCDIDPVVRFDRKQYFYPDLPKGYQISQHEHPLCANGQLTVPVPSEGGTITVTIQRAHVEEDAGKLVHAGAAQLTGGDAALVDYNRAGKDGVRVC